MGSGGRLTIKIYIHVEYEILLVYFWIDRGWYWSDNKPTGFTNWAVDEPNNDNEDEECVEMIPSSGRWNDNNCEASRPFICKRLKSWSLSCLLYQRALCLILCFLFNYVLTFICTNDISITTIQVGEHKKTPILLILMDTHWYKNYYFVDNVIVDIHTTTQPYVPPDGSTTQRVSGTPRRPPSGRVSFPGGTTPGISGPGGPAAQTGLKNKKLSK